MTLSAFLSVNALTVENEKYVASKRFVDPESGQPVEWEIRAITSTDDEKLRKDCTKRVAIPGKRGQYTPELDVNLYIGKLAVMCTVFPNLNDSELQDSYGVMGADSLLKTMLMPGEYVEYVAKVQEINGFDKEFQDLIEDAKN